MASIIINGVTFVNPPNQVQVCTVDYRKASDPDVPGSYTVVTTTLAVPTSGIVSPGLAITPVDQGTTYVVRIKNNCSAQVVSVSIPVNTPTTFAWLACEFVCEQSGYQLVNSYAGFASPNTLFFNQNDSLMYVVDTDDPAGNVFWFNPNTLPTVNPHSSVVHATGLQDVIYAFDFDRANNRIYLAGNTTGGLRVFDMGSKTFVGGTIGYGVNGSGNPVGTTGYNFDRLVVKKIGNNIYCASNSGGTITIVNAANLAATPSTFATSTIPGRGGLSGANIFGQAFIMNEVGNEIWVSYGGGRSFSGIDIYDQTLTTHLAYIDIDANSATSGGTWGFNNYFGQSIVDTVKNRFYHYDAGASTLTIINTTTRAIVKTIRFKNREGKAFSDMSFTIDDNTGKLILSWQAFNTPSDASNTFAKRTYIFNRDTLEIERMIPNILAGVLTEEFGTRYLWGSDRGNVRWTGQSSYNTDGYINKLSY